MRPIAKVYTALIFLFLFAPIAIMLFFSFNSGNSLSVFSGFSLYWSMGNVIMILQSLILRKIVDPEKIAAEVKQQIEASQKTKKTKEKVMTVTQDGVTKQVVVKGSELDKMRLLRARERDASRYDD